MSRTVLYILNEEPTYLALASNSLQMLRKYNPTVPVRILFVEDGRRDSRKGVDAILAPVPEALLPIRTQEAFFSLCDKLNIEVWRRPVPDLRGEEGYPSAQRCLIQECPEPTILLLDADTFIWGDVEPLFDAYPGLDFVASPNNYGDIGPLRIGEVDVRPFNSGVVLWQNGWAKAWSSQVIDYCLKLKHRQHPMSEWLWSVSTADCGGREEFACTLFVVENNLRYAYFQPEHCQTNQWKQTTLIFHPTSPEWPRYFLALNQPKAEPVKTRKVTPRLVRTQ